MTIDVASHVNFVDLGGCANVRVINCTFLGMNPVANRSYIEAIQIDVNLFSACPWKSEPVSPLNGLPTRDVVIEECYFAGITVGSTTYPAPNPVGSHPVALETDAGDYENILALNNTVRGTNIPATQACSGWRHFYGARGVQVSGNRFYWTGAAGVAGNPQVISAISAINVIPTSVVGSSTPGSVAATPTRMSKNITISNNGFIGFSNGPTQSDTGLINLVDVTSASVIGNVSDGSASSFLRLMNAVCMVANNVVTINGTEPGFMLSGCSNGHVKDNTIAAATNTAAAISSTAGSLMEICGNVIGQSLIGILIDGTGNSLILSDIINSFTARGISIGPSGSANTTADIVISMNRVGSGGGGTNPLIGSTSTRTRRFGILCRSPGVVTDNGVGTTTVATDQTS